MSTITHNGVEYEVEHNDQGLYRTEFIIIWTLDELLVADADIIHDGEIISVTYKCSDGTYVDSDSTYPYHDFVGDDKVNKLAQWLVATHPDS